MRIGFDAKRLFLNNRGLGNYARNLLYGLEKYYPEHDYLLFTPRISNEYVSPILLKSDNIIVNTPQGLAKHATSYWRSFKLGSEAQKNKLNIYHGLAQELPRDIRKSKAGSVVTIHDMIFLQHPEFYKPIDRWIYYNKVKFAVHNADVVVAISHQTKNDLVEEFNISEDRIKVIYQSCNEIFYSKRTASELKAVKEKWSLPDSFLLYVGALNENKNVAIILAALNELKGKSDLPLVVVGHGDAYKKKMIDYAHQHGLQSQLIFASEVANPSPRELSAFYQLASVFIFPSFYEGFGIPILEARFSGTPVIASNSSCLQEAGESDAIYFAPTDFTQLASMLLDKLSKPSSVNQPTDFTLESITNKWIELYDRTCSI